ncbi:MAG: sigma-70 family RNA polymerase sigma factor [Phycisphaerales bacterium]|nr:sigma-70 family RNA polymerase sigma factor [Phycisphaerales bacterium]
MGDSAVRDKMEQTGASFVTTCWTLIDRVRSGDENTRRAAAEECARLYWPPVYACARRLTRTRDEALDLTQAFFADVVLTRGLFDRADQAAGSARSLVRAALKRFATDQWRRGQARGQGLLVSGEAIEREESLARDEDPGTAFDRRWALAMFEESMRRCEAHFQNTGRGQHWRLFETRVVRESLVPLSEAAATHGFESAALAAAAVQTVKRRLDAILREVVAETAGDQREATSEFEQVVSMLSPV